MSEEPHLMSTADRLIYMANQIARNFASLDDDRAAAAVRDHLVKFWDPRMKRRILDAARDQPDRFSPIVAAALASMPGRTSVDQSGRTLSNGAHEAGRQTTG